MSSAVSWTWQFVKRHRGKLMLTGGVVGGYVLLNKYLSAWERAWQKSSSRHFISEIKKKEIHFENTIETGNQTCLALTKKIVDLLDGLLDAEPILDRIRSAPEEKVQLFDKIKVLIFTRMAAEVYALVLPVALLRIQLAILAGYIYVDKNYQNESLASSSSSSTSVQTQYLSLLQTFYQEGIHQVIEPVQEAVKQAMEGVSLKDKVTFDDIKKLFDSVKLSMSLKLSGNNSNASTFLLLNQDKLMKSRTPTMNEVDVEQLKKMLAETMDLLESDDFKKVLESGVDVGFSIVLDLVFNSFVNLADDSNGSFNPHNVCVPLAKLLPALRHSMSERNPSDRMAIAKHLICLDVLNCFAANIYEAFCNAEESNKANGNCK